MLTDTESSLITYELLRLTEINLLPKITQYAFEQLGDSFIEDAWDDFNDYANEEPFDPENLLNIAFTPWLLYVWPLNLEYAEENRDEPHHSEIKTLASLYLGAHLLSEAERQYITASNNRPYRIFEVLKTSSDIHIRDMFSNETLTIPDIQGTKTIAKGSIFMARIAHVESAPNFTVGHFPFALNADKKDRIQSLKDEIIEATQIQIFDEEVQKKIESRLITGFLNLVDEQLDEVDEITILDAQNAHGTI